MGIYTGVYLDSILHVFKKVLYMNILMNIT